MRVSLLALTGCLCASLLMACGSGDTNTVIESNPVGPFMPYLGSLHVVDMGDAQRKTYTITDKAVKAAKIINRYTYSEARDKIVEITPEYVVYVQENKIWKTDLRVGSDLKDVQVSNAEMQTACLAQGLTIAYKDTTDAESARLYWSTPGIDGSCVSSADNVRWTVRLTDGAGVNPYNVTQLGDPLATQRLEGYTQYYEHPDGRSVGENKVRYLAVNGLEIVAIKVKPAGNEKQVIATAQSEVILFSRGKTSLGVFIIMDKTLYWYQWGASALSEPLLSNLEINLIRTFKCDASNCFFSVEGPDPDNQNSKVLNFYRVSSSGVSQAAALTTKGLSNPDEIVYTTLSNNYVYFLRVRSNLNDELARIPKIGGDVIKQPSNSPEIYISAVSPTHVYYNTIDERAGYVTKIHVIKEDGTYVRIYDDALWIKTTAASLGVIDGVPNIEFDKGLYINNALAHRFGGAAAELRAIDVATNTDKDLGRLPSKNRIEEFTLVAGNRYVFSTTDFAATQKNTDVFYIDLSTENSLVRLSATPNINEDVVR